MPRWEPGASRRLLDAALELFEERGYDATTVEDVASRAGVTKRTFFRHFPDKRDVLSGGEIGEAFVASFGAGLEAVPADVPTPEALTRCLEHVAVAFRDRRAFATRRWRLLESHDALRERELVKMAAVSRALAASLGRRGVGEPAASVAADATVAAFRIAYARWALLDDDLDLGEVARGVMAALRDVLAVDRPQSR